MKAWILDAQPFVFSNVQEFGVCTDKCGSLYVHSSQFIAYHESTCKLHSIVSTQAMYATEIASIGIDGGCDFYNAVPPRISTKKCDDVVSLSITNALAEVLLSCLATERCYCFYQCCLRDDESMTRFWLTLCHHPGTTRLSHISLNQGRCIEIIYSH